MNCNQCGGYSYPFPQADCSNANFQGPSGPYPCRPHYPSLRKNFTAGAAGTPLVIEVTNTAALTVGQGILIGSGFWIITDVLDSLRLEVQHNGVGVNPGDVLIAFDQNFHCYNHPIVPVGRVSLSQVPSVVGLNNARDTAVGGSVLNQANRILTYGMVGPTTLEFSAQVDAEIANTPYWVGISLPYPITALPLPMLRGSYFNGSNFVNAVALPGAGAFAQYAVVGPGGGGTISNGAGQKFFISGTVEIAV